MKIENIVLGASHSLCLLRNGKVLAWGSSKDGKMGLEGAMDRNFLTPKEITTLDNISVYQMAAGTFHTLILTEEGEIYSFGNSKDGKLGYDDPDTCVMIPRKIKNCPVFAKKFNNTDDRNSRFPLFSEYDDYFVYLNKGNKILFIKFFRKQ